jgi:hypothetical protein
MVTTGMTFVWRKIGCMALRPFPFLRQKLNHSPVAAIDAIG